MKYRSLLLWLFVVIWTIARCQEANLDQTAFDGDAVYWHQIMQHDAFIGPLRRFRRQDAIVCIDNKYVMDTSSLAFEFLFNCRFYQGVMDTVEGKTKWNPDRDAVWSDCKRMLPKINQPIPFCESQCDLISEQAVITDLSTLSTPGPKYRIYPFERIETDTSVRIVLYDRQQFVSIYTFDFDKQTKGLLQYIDGMIDSWPCNSRFDFKRYVDFNMTLDSFYTYYHYDLAGIMDSIDQATSSNTGRLGDFQDYLNMHRHHHKKE